jgi:hypothetical protein
MLPYRMGILYHWVNSLGIAALLKDVAYCVAVGVSGFMVVWVYICAKLLLHFSCSVQHAVS